MRILANGLIMAMAFAGTSATTPLPSPHTDNPAERLKLAERYVEITHRQKIMRDVYAKELRAAWAFCHEPLCQADLDKAILVITEDVSQKYAANVAQLYAQKLTVRQLNAIVRFSASKEGQEIVQAQDAMTDQLAQIGRATALYSQKEVSRRFCPAHPEVCVTSLGVKPPTPPST